MYVEQSWWDAEVYMQDFKEEKNMISIRQTVKKHPDLVKQLIAIHAVSGCDTVPSMFGIGKVKCLNVAKRHPFECIGKPEADLESILREGKTFVL